MFDYGGLIFHDRVRVLEQAYTLKKVDFHRFSMQAESVYLTKTRHRQRVFEYYIFPQTGFYKTHHSVCIYVCTYVCMYVWDIHTYTFHSRASNIHTYTLGSPNICGFWSRQNIVLKHFWALAQNHCQNGLESWRASHFSVWSEYLVFGVVRFLFWSRSAPWPKTIARTV